MTTKTLTHPSAFHHSLRNIIAGAFVLLAALTVVLVLALNLGTSTAGGTGVGSHSGTSGHHQDTSNCRPTTVEYFC
jgi:hypothetical protein